MSVCLALLGCSHTNNIDIPKPNFNINRFRADWNAFSGDDTVEVYCFERMPCSWSCSVLFIIIVIATGECVVVFLLLLLSPLAYYFSKHWNCSACNINNDDIKSIFDNGKCLIQSMAWYGRAWTGYFHWAFPFKGQKQYMRNWQQQLSISNDLWWMCAGHINPIYIDSLPGRKKKKKIL